MHGWMHKSARMQIDLTHFYVRSNAHGKLVQLFLKALMDLWVNVPEDVELAYKKKQYEESVMLEKFDDKDPEEVCLQAGCVRAHTRTHAHKPKCHIMG